MTPEQLASLDPLEHMRKIEVSHALAHAAQARGDTRAERVYLVHLNERLRACRTWPPGAMLEVLDRAEPEEN